MEALMAIENGFIDNVYFFYTRIQEPTNKWESEEKEWKGKQQGYKGEVNRWNKEVERQQKISDSYNSLAEVK